jgi:hypothetical protein
MVFLGDASPMFMASDMLGANAIAGVVCSTRQASRPSSNICYQGALAIIEQNKPGPYSPSHATCT